MLLKLLVQRIVVLLTAHPGLLLLDACHFLLLVRLKSRLEAPLWMSLQTSGLAALRRIVCALRGNGHGIEGIVDVCRTEACNCIVYARTSRTLGSRTLFALPCLFTGTLAPAIGNGRFLFGQLCLALGLFAGFFCLFLGFGLGTILALAFFAARIIPGCGLACLGSSSSFSSLFVGVGGLFGTARLGLCVS